MEFETILYNVSDGVAEITLNRPEVLNGLNDAIIDDLRKALRFVNADAEARAVIITGAGRGFSSGADLAGAGSSMDNMPPGLSAGDMTALKMTEYYNPIILDINRLEKPVIMAVNGVTAGGGVGLAMSGDIVIAARSAYFVQVFAPKLGIIPDMGTTWFLPRLVGRARALGLAMLGDKLPAETAAEWGLIWKCVDDDDLMDEARKIAAQIAAGPPLVWKHLKRAIAKSEENSLADQLELEREIQQVLCGTEDFMEGVKSFLTKTQADFKGK